MNAIVTPAIAPAAEAPKVRLKTSAMIASIAAEGQRTTSAPFGHALAALAEQRPEIVGQIGRAHV